MNPTAFLSQVGEYGATPERSGTRHMGELLHPERVRQPECQLVGERLSATAEGKLDFGNSPAPHPSSLELDGLAEYRQSLRSLRCVNCNAAINLTDGHVIQRTRTMLGIACKSSCAHVPRVIGTDGNRLPPSLSLVSQVQRVVVRWRRHVPCWRQPPCVETCGVRKRIQT
jgi:hypothetical protein